MLSVRRRARSRRLLPAALAALAALPAAAITDSDFQGAVNYDFRPPGARALAMGGAFSALADDATAALDNPAGLAQLRKPEFTLAGKSWGDDMHLDWGDGAMVDLRGDLPTFPAAFRESRDHWSTRAGPAFAGYARPFGRVTLALFAARIADTDNRFARDPIVAGPVLLRLCQPACQSAVVDGLSTTLTTGEGRIRVQRFGMAGSVALSPRLSAGAAFFLGRLDYRATSARYTRTPAASGQDVILTVDERGRDGDPGFSAGLHYHGARWSAGASWQHGENFKVAVDPRPGPAGASVAFIAPPFTTSMKVPDRWTLGLAVRALPTLVFSGELEAVRWSRTAAGLVSFHPQEIDARYRMADALNPHLGVEYVTLADGAPLSLRAGIWREGGHRLEYRGRAADVDINLFPGGDLIIPGSSTDNAQRALFPGGGEQTHFTAGIGFVLDRLQFDAGYDGARFSRQFSLAAVFHPR